MSTPKKVARGLWVTMFVVAIVEVAHATAFFPLHVGQVWEFIRYDTDDPTGWVTQLEIIDQATFGAFDYFHVQNWNYGNDGQTEDEGYVRSTDTALYGYNDSGDDILIFQQAAVGTKWSSPSDGGEYPYEVTEIVAIESVTVPYATFDQAYKHRSYGCHDPNNLGLGKSPDYYTWIVPGIGMVKEEDYWTDYPPAFEELVGMIVVPVCRFWSPVNSRHFYTITEGEKQTLIDNYSHVWTYEGVAYRAFAGASEAGLVPVYRFWSPILSGHFYTTDTAERDKLINDYSDVWTYEGPVFYAYPEGSEPAEASPVYRFWSDTLSCHFYTIDEAERDKLINIYSHVWTYEGIAWYAYE